MKKYLFLVVTVAAATASTTALALVASPMETYRALEVFSSPSTPDVSQPSLSGNTK